MPRERGGIIVSQGNPAYVIAYCSSRAAIALRSFHFYAHAYLQLVSCHVSHPFFSNVAQGSLRFEQSDT